MLRLLLLLVFVFACNPDYKKQVKPQEVRNRTTQNSVLFFKNMRSLDYQVIEMPQTKRNLYRYKESPQDSTQIQIGLALVEKWDTDQAYVLLEPNEKLNDFLAQEKTDTLKVYWQNPHTKAQGSLQFVWGHVDTHFIFASQLYNALIEDCVFHLKSKTQSEPIPFLKQSRERENFRIVMQDYYRLVNIFK
ncbi:hypothetical protein [Hugenholtzia roseola]|uniref:hypothetical protein n=1 Tax=Hugenholtzia roseola TaxID=1002 RepID=UPI0012B5E9F8|nr:hypothetical protein [Hugenholtzia roseola]